MRTLPSTPILLLALAALSWGLASALSKIAVEELTSVDLFGVEVATGALCLGIAAFVRGARPGLPGLPLLVLGLLNPGLAFLLFDLGIARTTATHAALLLSTDTLFTAALAWALLHERLDRRLALALAFGVAGSALVSLAGGGGMSSLAGDLLVVAASLSAAGYGVLAKRATARHDAVALTAAQMLIAGALAAPLLAVAVAGHHSHLGHAGAGYLLAACAVGLLGSVVPFVLYIAAIERVTVTRAGLVLTLVPLFGALSSVVLLGEGLGAPQSAGGALVVLAAGVAAR
jgi:drug/metabolite transporter (DMT)-like permease